MFAPFAVLVAADGSDFTTVQGSLMEKLLTDHGAQRIAEAHHLLPTIRSVSRRGRKTVVVLTGRDSVEAAERDVVARWLREQPQRDVAPDILAMRQFSSMSTSVTQNPPASSQSAILLRFVRQDWVTHSIQQRRCLALETYTLKPAGLHESMNQPQATVDDKGRVVETIAAAGDVGSGGFLPVFFASAAHSQSAGYGKRTREANPHSSNEEDQSRSRRAGNRLDAVEAPSWSAPSLPQQHERTADARHDHHGEHHLMVIEPHHVPHLVRMAQRVDRLKPFACQKPPPTVEESTFAWKAPEVEEEDDNYQSRLSDDEKDNSPVASTCVDAESSSEPSHKDGGAAPLHSAASEPANQRLLSELGALKEIYRATGDTWRSYAYDKAIGIIKRVPFPIQSAEQLSGYRGIGEKLLLKIKEILATGSSVKRTVLQSMPHVQAIEAFSKIWGVGPSTARRIAADPALNSIGALRAAPNITTILSASQLVGLRHYEDLQVRIPRAEVELLTNAVGAALKRVLGASRAAAVDVVACGSYRRGRPTSGDVDILMCDRGGSLRDDGLLRRVVDDLRRPAPNPNLGGADAAHPHHFIVEDLTVSYHSLQHVHHDSWFGVVQLPDCSAGDNERGNVCPCSHRNAADISVHPPATRRFERGVHLSRRMDIKLYPPEHFAFALLYFTGSDYFNRSMRLYCQKKGWSLSDHDLKPVVRVRGEKVHETSYGIPCQTEKDIFDAVGLPYKEPRDRDL